MAQLDDPSTIRYGVDLSVAPEPLRAPTTRSPHVLIIGAGVSGLCTAWALLDSGYHVTVIASEFANDSRDGRLTAQIAGALWEFPPAVCGLHTFEQSLECSKRWCMVAYYVWSALERQHSAQFGVRMKKAAFFFPYLIESDLNQFKKMLEIKRSGVDGFNRSPDLVDTYGVSQDFGVKDAYEHLAPVIDTDVAMYALMQLTKAKGATFIRETLTDDLLNLEPELLRQYNASAIVNASGLGSLRLASDDTCYPLRGALIHLINDGSKFPKVDAAMSISADASDDNTIVFLVPRNDQVLVMGGIAQAGEWNRDLTIDDPVIKRMRERCEDFLPALKHAEVKEDYSFAQGCRPFRAENVRVERELREAVNGGHSKIVHNYGHGGAGWSLSFGCAFDVVHLVEEAIRGLPARSMVEVYSRQTAPMRPVQAML